MPTEFHLLSLPSLPSSYSYTLAGQYWQSVKSHSGSVGLSYLVAQRRDCEETDAVNALASLSVGVLTNKRYGTPIHKNQPYMLPIGTNTPIALHSHLFFHLFLQSL